MNAAPNENRLTVTHKGKKGSLADHNIIFLMW